MRRESGDTLVEVLIAIAILAMAVVGGLGVMNFGFGVVLNAIGRTEVQASVSSQLSLIQYARDSYARNGRSAVPGGAAVWDAIIKNKLTTTYSPSVCNDDASPATDATRKPFYVNEDGDTPLGEAPTKAVGYATAGNGLWVEAVQPTGANYIDFYVKACWEPVAGANNEESRSVMRLYAPAPVALAVAPPAPSPPCNNLDTYANNLIRNGTFAISAGNGPGISPGAEFTSELPNRGSNAYPDDFGLNGTAGPYTGGFSLQTGDKAYGLDLANPDLFGFAFRGDGARGVPAIQTWYYSNPNQRASQPPQPPGSDARFVGTLWQQSVTGLEANTTYDFTAYFDNLLLQIRHAGAVDPQVQLRVNGSPVNAATMTIGKDPDVDGYGYKRVTLVFTTNSMTTITTPVSLEIYDLAGHIHGDDFAMTALALRKCV